MIFMLMKANKVWTGLETIIPLEGNKELGSPKGASVNILHCVYNEKDYENKIKNQFLEYSYELQELKDVESFITF